MYITPSLLSSADWNVLADAANWARHNADILKDTHWIGGDPGQLQVYGWAAWSPRGWIVTLRNPSDKPQTYTLNLKAALEVPERANFTTMASDPFGRPVESLTQFDPHHAEIRLGTLRSDDFRIHLGGFRVSLNERKPGCNHFRFALIAYDLLR